MRQMGFAGPETPAGRPARDSFRFDQEKEEGKLDDKAVWILRGTWRRSPPGAGRARSTARSAATGLLPPYIPMDATLYLGKDDGWPYKLVLVGRKPTILMDTRKEGRSTAARSAPSARSNASTRPNITLVYTNVKINPTLRPGRVRLPGSQHRLGRGRHRDDRQGARLRPSRCRPSGRRPRRPRRTARPRSVDRHPPAAGALGKPAPQQ